ncbi:MAG: hypothetical protein QXQ29_01260 [Candidatus Bathyarchaeia archaeon]
MFKREVRVLGLTYRIYGNYGFILGVVFRGRLWLDGILYRKFKIRCDILDELISMLDESPHKGQMRVIAIDSSLYSMLGSRGIEMLHTKFKLPIIVFDGAEVIVAIGVSNVEDFLRVAASEGRVEALRIASAIADRLFELLTFKS